MTHALAPAQFAPHLSKGQLLEARIPFRFWVLESDPFTAFPAALAWWEARHILAPQGRGILGAGEAALPAMVAVLKRLMRENNRPRVMSGEDSPCTYVEAADLYAAKTYEISDLQRAMFEVPYLIIANTGQQSNSRLASVMGHTLRRRHLNGVVTFLHLQPDAESVEAVQQVVEGAPSEMFAAL